MNTPVEYFFIIACIGRFYFFQWYFRARRAFMPSCRSHAPKSLFSHLSRVFAKTITPKNNNHPSFIYTADNAPGNRVYPHKKISDNDNQIWRTDSAQVGADDGHGLRGQGTATRLVARNAS